MPQQINLCTTVAVSQRQRFSAATLAAMLAGSLVLLIVVGGFWLWSLERSAQAFRLTLDAQANEIQNLQAAIQRSRSAAGPADPAVLRELQDRRVELTQREKALQFLRQGLFVPGLGHSDRLLLLAQSIPSDTWLTTVHADSAAFEVSGFTLEPASLNEWVAHLGTQALMSGLKLDTVAVNFVTAPGNAAAKSVEAPSSAAPMWSFHLISVSPVATAVPGDKP